MHLTRIAVGAGLALASAISAQSEPQPSNPSTASVTDNYMGPAAFMWPPDRVWSGDMDNQAPCGSRAAAGNRTKFPITGGSVALVAQDDYYNSKISISYKEDPQTNTDFSVLLETIDISDLNPGHTCVSVPDAPSRVTAGTNATLQIIYKADWDAPHNQTFYACADITYVNQADFKLRIPCFNATEPGEDDKKFAAEKDKPAGDSKAPTTATSGGSGSGLKGGALAGVIVGSILGACLIAAAGLFLYRRREQKLRQLRLAKMEENAKKSDYRDDRSVELI
ncbi:cytokine inducing-glycoprotein, partial [Metarhizium majus ARSEF 297]